MTENFNVGDLVTFKTHPLLFDLYIKGDGKYLSIAAASILAKTFRDDFMVNLDSEYPIYNWKSNMGYPTFKHQKAILEYGRSPFHRKSFHIKTQLKIQF